MKKKFLFSQVLLTIRFYAVLTESKDIFGYGKYLHFCTTNRFSLPKGGSCSSGTLAVSKHTSTTFTTCLPFLPQPTKTINQSKQMKILQKLSQPTFQLRIKVVSTKDSQYITMYITMFSTY